MQRLGLENYSYLRQWAGIPVFLEEIIIEEVEPGDERVEGYQNLGSYEEIDLNNERRIFTLWKKNENSLLKWARVAVMIAITITVIIPIFALFCSLKSDYANALCPDRIYKKRKIIVIEEENFEERNSHRKEASFLVRAQSNVGDREPGGQGEGGLERYPSMPEEGVLQGENPIFHRGDSMRGEGVVL